MENIGMFLNAQNSKTGENVAVFPGYTPSGREGTRGQHNQAPGSVIEGVENAMVAGPHARALRMAKNPKQGLRDREDRD